MAEYLDREHFIPLRKNDLMELLLHDKQLPPAGREPFRQFCRLVGATLHFEYLTKLEELKDAYAPFDPDADTRPPKPLPPEQRQECEDKVFAAFASLMHCADFKRLKEEEIQHAVRQTPSDWGLHMDLDLNVFERLEVYTRGDVVREQTRRSWRACGGWRNAQGADVSAAGAGPEAAAPPPNRPEPGREPHPLQDIQGSAQGRRGHAAAGQPASHHARGPRPDPLAAAVRPGSAGATTAACTCRRGT